MTASALWLAPAPLLLASASATRRDLLASAGLPVETAPARIDERALEAESGGLAPAALALRLARFNAAIDAAEQPHKSAGFLTGVPAPAGAALALLPLFLWFVTEAPILRDPRLVAPWTIFVALLMVSSIATFSWTSLRLRRNIRFEAIAVVVLVGAAAVSAPWQTAAAGGVAYLFAIPFSIASYGRIKRLRAGAPAGPAPSTPPSA